MPALPAAGALLGCGALLGALNGYLVTRWRILPLIATLGTFYVYSGLAVALTNGAAQAGVPAWLIPWGRGAVAGVPLPFLTLALPRSSSPAFSSRFTSWGRWISRSATMSVRRVWSASDVDRVRLVAYAAGGCLAGSRRWSRSPGSAARGRTSAQNLELTSLTAAMLGGVAIFGGEGGVVGVLAAVLLLVTLQTACSVNVNSVWQVGIVGVLLIVVC